MAWVIGLVTPEEEKSMVEAGYEVNSDYDFGSFTPEDNEDSGMKMVAVFVDCNVDELLQKGGE